MPPSRATIETFPTPPDNLSFGEVKLHFAQILIPEDTSLGLVPAYKFRILLFDGSDAGHLNFRVGDTAHVTVCVGHIGFSVLEPFRGHSYAQQACRAVAPFVRTFYETVIITCDPDNFASMHTIEKLGAVFIDEVSVPPHDPHYPSGSWSKRRYRWTP